MKYLFFAALAALSIPALAIDNVKEVSGVYVGGHIRRERPATITKLRESGFTYAILFNVDVKDDGTLTTDGDTICYKGKYVFDKKHPHYVQDVKDLKTAPTSISRIEICIGGWKNASYGNIKSLIAKSGTTSTSMLYKNFKALKESIPEIDAVNNDQEQDYDVDAAVKFHVMMHKLGYKTSIAPYTYWSYWQSFVSNLEKQRPGACDRVMVQCYDGGAGNNPSDWHLSNITLHAGLLNYSNDWSVDKNMAQFENWRDNCGVTGGFVWVYNDESWDLNAWASGMNRVFGASTVDPDSVVAKFYSQTNYRGYCVGLPAGDYSKGEMAAHGLKANDLESVEFVKEGYYVYLYRGTTCTNSGRVRLTDSKKSISSYANNVNAIRIEAIPDAIDTTQANELSVKLQDREVRVVNGRGLTATVSTLSGVQVMSVCLDSNAEILSLRDLPSSVYVVRVGDKTLKARL